MSVPEQFTGLAGYSKEEPYNLKEHKYTPRKWSEDDVDIKVFCCGVCGSDLHVLRSGWFPTPYPQIVGHEIVGTVVRVGKNVKHLKEGDRVGVGAQCGSCHSCDQCHAKREQYCPTMVQTYGAQWPDGTQTHGGYADYIRVDSQLAFTIPESLTSEQAAPLLCAGITVYSPLRRNNAGPGKKVGIIGVGGLGHLGIQFAAALGAEVTAISRNKSKWEDVQKMGASKILALEDAEDVKKFTNYFDLIICTSYQDNMKLDPFLSLLAPVGTFVILGASETPTAPFSAFGLIFKGASVQGSLIGSPEMIKEMLEVAAKHNVKTWIETRPMSEATKTLEDMEANKARYRYVLLAGK